mmetsp:Transcript_24408/g.84842  ORF Transcript_24408/g.84842 Transcript_24408/m.84842 type:complete len:257 (-) Transcript_24408:1924-2694(-)
MPLCRHESGPQADAEYWQRAPSKPGGHWHWAAPLRTVQVPPDRHGSPSHTCREQSSPKKPSSQMHVRALPPLRHSTVFASTHGASVHRSTRASHWTPSKPVSQAHTKPEAASAELEQTPCWHGFGLHASSSLSQFSPSKPSGHAHEYSPTAPCEHTPPFLHGWAAHSSTSVAQSSPAKPVLHKHTRRSPRSMQAVEPAAWHGDAAHRSTASLQRSPVQPASQSQEKVNGPWLRQEPCAPHGFSSHASISCSQLVPS